MTEEKFILTSLEDSKNLGEIISNKTAKKILDYLSSKNDVSETNLAKELNLPLSTIHYNLEKLKEAGLITAKLFKWSEKGNKIHLYSLANKLIIIAPKKIHSNFKDNIKNLLFSAISSVAVLGIIKVVSNSSRKVEEEIVQDSIPTLAASKEGAFATSTPQAIQSVQSISPEYYFVLAIVLMVVFYIIFDALRKTKASTKIEP